MLSARDTRAHTRKAKLPNRPTLDSMVRRGMPLHCASGGVIVVLVGLFVSKYGASRALSITTPEALLVNCGLAGLQSDQ